MTHINRNDLARALIGILPMITRLIDGQMREQFQRITPPHFGLLKMLSHRPMTQSELALYQQVGASTMSATVDALVKRGWVSRERSEQDRRVTRIMITAKGRAMLESFDEQVIAGIRAMLDPLNEDEAAQLQAGLAIMQRIFSAALPKDLPPPPMPFMIPLPPPPDMLHHVPPGMLPDQPFTIPLPPPPDVLHPMPPGAPHPPPGMPPVIPFFHPFQPPAEPPADEESPDEDTIPPLPPMV